ncbi:MAG: Fic family protein [Epsilonproteobacteria bacterium]|nr:Fic family protein [Campylobacterota bacterium]
MYSNLFKIPDPKWGSNLANLIIDLEKLKVKRLEGEIPPYIFFQLKNIFQILETLGSARIEGNNTTLAEYIEEIMDGESTFGESRTEIENIEKAINFIEENIENNPLDRAFISQLHKIVTSDLTPPPKGEGSRYPGELRRNSVKIVKSKHIPPEPYMLQEYFDGFVNFINQNLQEQYQLLMVAIAHHRFNYIHPFDNANGRVGRLLNYALLIKLGFRVKNGRILNPSAVFYVDRDRYYRMLSTADSLDDEDVLRWCEYFLSGLKNEIEKIDSLLDRNFVKDKILLRSVDFATQRGLINPQEEKILKLIVKSDDMAIKSQELSKIGITKSIQKTRAMNKLKDQGMVKATKKGGRVYTVDFRHSYLLRGVIKSLEKEGFVSDFLEKN